MRSSYTKWLGAGLGWMSAGPFGALIGYYLGQYLGKQFSSKRKRNEASFEMSLLILATIVIKADGIIKKAELDYVRSFFIKSFGKTKADIYFKVFNEIKNKPFPSIRSICLGINQSVNHETRLQIIHFLFSIANSDGEIDSSELNIIKKIANYFWISSYDFNSMKSMFLNEKNIETSYSVLGLKQTSTDEEVKRSYRKMVKKYHPDKLTSVSKDVKNMAKQKFQSLQDAYKTICKERGI